MLISEILIERRRQPDKNVKETPVEFLRKYKDNPKMYLHTAPLLKVGIYPKSRDGHDSPLGVYAYRLADIWEDSIERWNTGDYKRGLEHLPYHGGDHLFVLESDIDPDFPGNYTEQDLANDVEKMKTILGLSDKAIDRLRRVAQTNQNFVDCPAGYLWGMTKALVAGVSEFDQYTPVNTKRWSAVLRKLGYVGFNDPGAGLIHGAESCQAVFLTGTAYQVVDHMLQNRRQKVVTISNDEKYKGGHLPKNLHMNGIPNVFFSNHDPEDFRKVRSWTIGGMGYSALSTFMHFLPWNAKGIVKNLHMGDSANEFYEQSSLRDFFAKTVVPDRITIENLSIGGRDPLSLARLMPENFPVQTITISKFASNYGMDKLPEPIRSKIRIV